MYNPPDHTTIYVEFCRACDTHSWCTHHDEAKYLSYFHKLSEYLNKNFVGIKVVGNQLPAYLTPLHGHDTKFYDNRIKKYVNFPAIGAFEIMFGGKLIFSKKKTNNWPDFIEIKNKVKQIITQGGQKHKLVQQPKVPINIQESDQENLVDDTLTEKQTFTTNKQIDNDDKRTTFYKPKQVKNFTLTDHFKIYKMQKKKQQAEESNRSSEKQENSVYSYKSNNTDVKYQGERKKNWQDVKFKDHIPNFIKQNAYINEEKGKKQMIINLDSIEQQTFIEQNGVPKRETGHSKSRDNRQSREVMRKWDEELNFLEHKFLKVQNSLSKIKQKNKQFDSSASNIQAEWINRINQQRSLNCSKDNGNTSMSPHFRLPSTLSPEQSRVIRNNLNLQFPHKLTKIDRYINSTQAEKNKKLHQIYGQWKIIKREPNLVQPRYLSYKKNHKPQSQSQQQIPYQKKIKTQKKYNMIQNEDRQSEEDQNQLQFPLIDKNKNLYSTTRNQQVNNLFRDQTQESGDGKHTASKIPLSRRKTRQIKISTGIFNENKARSQDYKYKQDDIQSVKTSSKLKKLKPFKPNIQKPINHGDFNKNQSEKDKNQNTARNFESKIGVELKRKDESHRQSQVVSTRTQKKSQFPIKIGQNIRLNSIKQNFLNQQDKVNKQNRKKAIQQKYSTENSQKFIENEHDSATQIDIEKNNDQAQQQQINFTSHQNTSQNQNYMVEESRQNVYSQQSEKQVLENEQGGQGSKKKIKYLKKVKQNESKDKRIKLQERKQTNVIRNQMDQQLKSERRNLKAKKQEKQRKHETKTKTNKQQQSNKQKQNEQFLQNGRQKNIRTKQEMNGKSKQKQNEVLKSKQRKQSNKQESLKKEDESKGRKKQQEKEKENKQKNDEKLDLSNSKMVQNKKINRKEQRQKNKSKKQELKEKEENKYTQKNNSKKEQPDERRKNKINEKDNKKEKIKQGKDTKEKDEKNVEQRLEQKQERKAVENKEKNKGQNKQQEKKEKQKQIVIEKKQPKQKKGQVVKTIKEKEKKVKEPVKHEEQKVEVPVKHEEKNQPIKHEEKNQLIKHGEKKVEEPVKHEQKTEHEEKKVEEPVKHEQKTEHEENKVEVPVKHEEQKVEEPVKHEQKTGHEENKVEVPVKHEEQKVEEPVKHEQKTGHEENKVEVPVKHEEQKVEEPVKHEQKTGHEENKVEVPVKHEEQKVEVPVKHEQKTEHEEKNQLVKHEEQKVEEPVKHEQKTGHEENKVEVPVKHEEKNQLVKHEEKKVEELVKHEEKNLLVQHEEEKVEEPVKHEQKTEHEEKKVEEPVKHEQKKVEVPVKHEEKKVEEPVKHEEKNQLVKHEEQKVEEPVKHEQKTEHEEKKVEEPVKHQEKNQLVKHEEKNQLVKHEEQKVEEPVKHEQKTEHEEKKVEEPVKHEEKNQLVKHEEEKVEEPVKHEQKTEHEEEKVEEPVKHEQKTEHEEKHSLIMQQKLPLNRSRSLIKQQHNQLNLFSLDENLRSHENNCLNYDSCQDLPLSKKNRHRPQFQLDSKLFLQAQSEKKISSHQLSNDKKLTNDLQQSKDANHSKTPSILLSDTKTMVDFEQKQISIKSQQQSIIPLVEMISIGTQKYDTFDIGFQISPEVLKDKKQIKRFEKKQIKQELSEPEEEKPQINYQRISKQKSFSYTQPINEQQELKSELNKSHKSSKLTSSTNKSQIKNEQKQNVNDFQLKKKSHSQKGSTKNQIPQQKVIKEVKQDQQEQEQEEQEQFIKNQPQKNSPQQIRTETENTKIQDKKQALKNIERTQQKQMQRSKSNKVSNKQDKKQHKEDIEPTKPEKKQSNNEIQPSQKYSEASSYKQMLKSQQKQQQIKNKQQVLKQQQILKEPTKQQLKIDSNLKQPEQLSLSHKKQQERALITNQLYGLEHEQEKQIFSTKLNKSKHILEFPKQYKYQTSKWLSLSKLYPKSQIFNTKDLGFNKIASNIIQLQNFGKAVMILGNIDPVLITRLFEAHDGSNLYGIWLCDHFKWRCCVIDDKIPVDNKNKPYNLFLHENEPKQIWLHLLEKAMALCLGGYEHLQSLQLSKILHMLTGSNVLSYRVREDPQKNSKLINSVKSCLQNNFFILCQKNKKSINDDLNKNQPVYRLDNIKKANNEEIVLQICEIKAKNQHKFWLKLQNFVQQFKSIQILQLNLKNSICRLSLQNKVGTMSIVCLEFDEDGVGSISVSNKYHSGMIKVFLYREQVSNTLKLVGQAKQKDKNQLFFDCHFITGKYLVFVEVEHIGSIVSYSGSTRPKMKVKQQIKADSYKNDNTEYLPISKRNKQNTNQNSARGSRFTNMSSIRNRTKQFDINVLKQNFIKFLAEQTQNQNQKYEKDKQRIE